MDGFETYEWETQLESDYRKKVAGLAGKMAEQLDEIGEVAKTIDRDYSGVKDSLRKLQRKHKRLEVPSMYEEANGFIAQALQAYIKGLDVLVIAVADRNATEILRAARIIMEGNNFITISKNRMWEAMDKRQKEKAH